MKKKYVLRPGRIQGKDEQLFEVNADTLANLYQVNHCECQVLHNNDSNFYKKFCAYVMSGYIFLYPRSDKNYSWLQDKLESC